MKILRYLSVMAVLVFAICSFAACDTRTPGEKVEDGVKDIGDGNISEGLDQVGEGAKDAAN